MIKFLFFIFPIFCLCQNIDMYMSLIDEGQESSVKEKLPENFQTAEYLKSHGMIDIVVPRSEQKTTISKLLKSLTFYLN